MWKSKEQLSEGSFFQLHTLTRILPCLYLQVSWDWSDFSPQCPYNTKPPPADRRNTFGVVFRGCEWLSECTLLFIWWSCLLGRLFSASSCPSLLVGSVLCSLNNFPLINRHFPVLFPKSPTHSPLPFIFNSSQLHLLGKQQIFLVLLSIVHMAYAIHFLFDIAFSCSADTCKACAWSDKTSPKERFCNVGSECWKLSEKQMWFSLPLLWGSMVWILLCFTPGKIESNPICNKAVEKATEMQQWDEAFTQSSKMPGCR